MFGQLPVIKMFVVRNASPFDIHPGRTAGFPNITIWVSASVPYGYFATAL
jgi:hypothetical protein